MIAEAAEFTLPHAGPDRNWRLPATLAVPALCSVLESAFTVRLLPPGTIEAAFYDTFEWNLWFENRLLVESGGTLMLATRDHDWIGETLESIPFDGGVPRFAANLPGGPLREALAPIVGLRGLTPAARLAWRRQAIELLNPDSKIVFRCEVQDVFAAPDSEALIDRICHVRPLRGYETEAARATGLLTSAGAEAITAGPLARYFHDHGIAPRRYTLRPAFALSPDLPAREAARLIIRRVLEILRENEAGLIADIDTEFLHDYRICIRKIRSLLSLVKGIYPDDKTEELKAAFSDLGAATNRLRDLDVYLLARKERADLLPPGFRPAIGEMFADFERERAIQHQTVAAALATDDYRRRVGAIEAFFTEPDALPFSAASALAIGPFVARRIYKRYRRIQRIERTLGHDTPDEAIHQIRINCKKLRYLLEFFSELFPADATRPIEKQLRRLQNRLGAFNDYSVQQKSLLDYWAGKRGEPGGHADLALAIGGLVAVLNSRQQAERQAIHDDLETFCSAEVSLPMKQTFKAREPGDDAPPDLGG